MHFFKPGDLLDVKWVIIEFLGRGGISEVYLAGNTDRKIEAAIKITSHGQMSTPLGKFLLKLPKAGVSMKACLLELSS
jgi:serine/threonine protein kinase